VIERFIASELVGKARLLDQAEREPGNHRADRRARHAVDGLSGRRRRKRRDDEDHRRGRDDGERRRDHEAALCFGCIDERAERRGRDHPSIAADSRGWPVLNFTVVGSQFSAAASPRLSSSRTAAARLGIRA
jgi:hypothetical protein